MSDLPFHGAFRHQHGDPRGLAERIHSQLRERIEEAVEMAGLKLMVDLRTHYRQPAPETSSPTDRREFEAMALGLLRHLHEAFLADLAEELRAPFQQARAGHGDERERLLLGQVFLARRLPDYWQRFERHQVAYSQVRLARPTMRHGPGWLRRLLGSP